VLAIHNWHPNEKTTTKKHLTDETKTANWHPKSAPKKKNTATPTEVDRPLISQPSTHHTYT